MTKIYTKKGDKGQTNIIGCKMSKGDKLADVLGSIDELNSWMGVVRAECTMNNLQFTILEKELRRIQTNLMTMASVLAGSKLKIKTSEVHHLEKLIDTLTKEVPILQNFIYPTGYLQYARAVARRMEREIVKAGIKEPIILRYANRLSDALFVMGRWVNFKSGSKEEIWGR